MADTVGKVGFSINQTNKYTCILTDSETFTDHHLQGELNEPHARTIDWEKVSGRIDLLNQCILGRHCLGSRPTTIGRRCRGCSSQGSWSPYSDLPHRCLPHRCVTFFSLVPPSHAVLKRIENIETDLLTRTRRIYSFWKGPGRCFPRDPWSRRCRCCWVRRRGCHKREAWWHCCCSLVSIRSFKVQWSELSI